jgi:hypothetical protein
MWRNTEESKHTEWSHGEWPSVTTTCRPGRRHRRPSPRRTRQLFLVLVGGVVAFLAIGGSQVGGIGRPGADSSYSVLQADLHHPAQTAPTTTSVPPTTVAPTTTSVPPTTVAPTTTPKPTPAATRTTTSVPPTTVAPTTTSVPAPAATPGLSSENWSGYVLTNGGYQEVGAEWTVPTLNCTVVPNGTTSDWVGVNGWVHPSQLFQAGTASTCGGGSQTNFAVWSDGALGYAWQEQFSVNTGDVIQVEISQTASGGWTALVTDVTSGQSATAGEAVAYAGASAEWVAEDSGVLGSSALASLADFGVVSFTNLSVSPSSAFSYSNAIEMQRADGSDAAMPSPVQGDASFSVTYEPTS